VRLDLPTPTRTRAVIAVAALTLVLAAVMREDVPATPSGPGAAPAPTSLEQLARADVVVARADFCDRVPIGQVEDALGAEVATSERYGPGDPGDFGAPGDQGRPGSAGAEVVHEYGCSWTTATGDVARAWVFAPPVTRARAARLATLLASTPGCERDPSNLTVPAYGDPTATITCGTGTGTVSRTRAGLFADAWLSCSLATPTAAPAAAPAADLGARSDAWCVSVAVAASTP